MKSFLITGDRSGSGKTSITLALSSILSDDFTVQTFKVAMDYIDPSYLTAVTGRPCRNLDSFVMTPDQIRDSYTNGCIGAEVAVIEGVRGLFEGSEALSDTGSTASVAKMLGQNVILVIDARSITRSAAAIVMGFLAYDPDVRIKGVILNQIISEKHLNKAKTAIEAATGIPVIGAIPRRDEMKLTMRHLGLIPFLEGKKDDEFLKRVDTVKEIVSRNIDIDALLGLAGESPAPVGIPETFVPAKEKDVKIGVAVDEAFNFYYNDVFDILGAKGAEIVTFSPVHDSLPEADGYILGGGYPEMFAGELEANDRVREAVLEVSKNGTPIYAECGGLIYLTGELVLKSGWDDLDENKNYSMCGVFDGKTVMPSKRVIGYVKGVSDSRSPLGEAVFSGHEFHHTDVRLPKDTHYSYRLSRGSGIIGGFDGAVTNRTQGSYTHLHPLASAGMIGNFVGNCRKKE
ncbi:Ni-sirohydrochlorin a,c-diamide synthase [Methanolacinia petrolearia]|uniref:Ni-sirohydrochlorin a,c-diamide synthase n=1 Tax=Methanolacinia petrolearia TaxID=54120 RepID=UPI003BA9643D